MSVSQKGQKDNARGVQEALQLRAPDKRGFEDKAKIFFSYFSMETYVVTTH